IPKDKPFVNTPPARCRELLPAGTARLTMLSGGSGGNMALELGYERVGNDIVLRMPGASPSRCASRAPTATSAARCGQLGDGMARLRRRGQRRRVGRR